MIKGIMTFEISRSKRERLPMPDLIRDALESNDLMELYNARPPYQRNDYIGWITRAKREETVKKRLDQMLDELRTGDKYMNMDWRPRNGRA